MMERVAYLMNTYPMTSTTFVRREIEAHERAGNNVDRFSVRSWSTALVDPLDIAEAQRVTYLLDKGVMQLFWIFLAEVLGNPRGMLRALQSTWYLLRKSRRKKWKNIAYLVEAVALKRDALARDIDHIHTHFSTNSAAVAMLSRRLGGPKYSVTVHGPDELYELKENAVDLKIKHAEFFVAITEYCRSVLDAFTMGVYSYKIHIIRCGLDMEDFPAPTEVPANKTLVCVGRLCEAKAQTLLVQAIARTINNHPDLQLILIGDGDTRKEINQLISAHCLESYVKVVGWKSNADVRKILSEARALVLPSLAEGLPVAIMESLALGRPVLSTRITGIPELVDEKCGWLVEPGNVAELASALDALLSTKPKQLTKMALVGRARVQAAHDQGRNAILLRKLFSSTCKAY
jgi:glycosyltransferase involved in cell wall biosynthesis